MRPRGAGRAPVVVDAAAPRWASPAGSTERAPVRDAGAVALHLDKIIDLGPSGSLAILADGVLLRTKAEGDPLLYRSFDRRKTDRAEEDVAPALLSVLPAPAISRTSRAYWVSHGRLVRRSFRRTGPGQVEMDALEELAADAYDATRTAVWTVGERDAVAYIARPSRPRGDRRARLWIDGGTSFDLSDDAAGASSLALVGEGDRIWAVSLDARAAMCPLHARTVEVRDGGPPLLGPDVVVFVGEPQASHTEISVALVEGEPIALVPLPKLGGGFGLASVAFRREPLLDSPARWTTYPKAADRALTAIASVGADAWIAYVRATDAASDADRSLVVAPLDREGPAGETLVAQARRFTSLSFVLTPTGAGAACRAGWIAWTADGRAAARAIRCP
jgi:hypothetical protein